MIIDGIDVTTLLKAREKFEEYRQNIKTERDELAAIQTFEFCFELTWKTMRRLLESRGEITNSPKATLRSAAQEGFITDPELWFTFLVQRNHTVHCYNEEVVSHVIKIMPQFSQALASFLTHIGALQ